jgi:REP element-mobilizing transposase RayT
MTNHFHFLIRIKDEDELLANLLLDRRGLGDLDGLITRQFSNFFNSYAKAFNKMYNRKGSLFMKNFKRLEIGDKRYLQILVRYIHLNPVESKTVCHPKDWKHSSYKTIINEDRSWLKSDQAIGLFDDLDNFVLFHEGTF